MTVVRPYVVTMIKRNRFTNLLTLRQSTIEPTNSTTEFQAIGPPFPTFARSTTSSREGSASLVVTCTGTSMDFRTWTPRPLVLTAGDPMLFACQFSQFGSAVIGASIEFFNGTTFAGSASLSTGSGTTRTVGGWTDNLMKMSAGSTVPVSCNGVTLHLFLASGASSGVTITVDRLGLFANAGSMGFDDWVAGTT